MTTAGSDYFERQHLEGVEVVCEKEKEGSKTGRCKGGKAGRKRGKPYRHINTHTLIGQKRPGPKHNPAPLPKQELPKSSERSFGEAVAWLHPLGAPTTRQAGPSWGRSPGNSRVLQAPLPCPLSITGHRAPIHRPLLRESLGSLLPGDLPRSLGPEAEAEKERAKSKGRLAGFLPAVGT